MVKTETIVCTDCDGKGVIYTTELVDYHQYKYIIKSKDCERCKCRGVLVQTTTVTTRALQPSEFRLCRGHNG